MGKKNAIVEAQLSPVRAELQAKRAAIHAELAATYAERDALIAQIQPLEAKLREVQRVIKAGEAPLREIGNNLAAIARAIGGTVSAKLEASGIVVDPGEIK